MSISIINSIMTFSIMNNTIIIIVIIVTTIIIIIMNSVISMNSIINNIVITIIMRDLAAGRVLQPNRGARLQRRPAAQAHGRVGGVLTYNNDDDNGDTEN